MEIILLFYLFIIFIFSFFENLKIWKFLWLQKPKDSKQKEKVFFSKIWAYLHNINSTSMMCQHDITPIACLILVTTIGCQGWGSNLHLHTHKASLNHWTITSCDDKKCKCINIKTCFFSILDINILFNFIMKLIPCAYLS
jgi:hypothetical protein